MLHGIKKLVLNTIGLVLLVITLSIAAVTLSIAAVALFGVPWDVCAFISIATIVYGAAVASALYDCRKK